MILEEIEQLDIQTGKMDVKIDLERSKLGGVNAAQVNNAAINKQVRVLENRLEKALVKFNKSLAVNKTLRAQIDNLRRERLVFDNIYHKFERELMDQKKCMADIIEASNAAYEARDEAQSKILVLREKAEKEYQAYTQEMKELDRVLEQDRRLKEFMATKNSNRAHKVGTLANPKKDSLGAKFPSQETIGIPLDTYESAFTEIRKVTGIDDIGELVEKFKAVEDQNFSLFNYVNEINNEIELHAEEIVHLQVRVNQMKVEAVEIEQERKAKLAVLEEQLKTANEKTDQFDRQSNEIGSVLSDLTQGVETVISTLQTIAAKKTDEEGSRPNTGSSALRRSEKVRQMIDFQLPNDTIGSVVVNESNLIQFLGLVESKANELLTLHYVVNSPKKAVQLQGEEGVLLPSIGLVGQGPMAPITNLSIIPPSTAYL
jgi:chromosome segregation ATPase